MRLKKWFWFYVLTGTWSVTYAQPQIELTSFTNGLSLPLGIESAGDQRLFILQQRGLIIITNSAGNQFPDPFLDLTNTVSQSGSERGLLGLAFHPDYLVNGYFFVNYTRESDGATVLARYTVSSDPYSADHNSELEILTIHQPNANHNGGNILFGADGYLYIAVGDGGGAGDPDNNAQNPGTLLGKILRIDVDNGTPYAIPADNPFLNTNDTLNEIWALGLRHHWRNSFDRFSGDLWIADVGQAEMEEVNFQSAQSQGGENYGWRCYEGSREFNLSGCQASDHYVFPVFEYEHYGSGCSGAIVGGYVYRGAIYNGLFGKYLTADFCHGDFYWVEQNGQDFNSGHIAQFDPLEFSSLGEDRYGELYVSLLNAGEIKQITDTSDCRPVAKIKEEEVLDLTPGDSLTLHAFFHPSLGYQWYRNDDPVSGMNQPDLTVHQTGCYKVEVTNPVNWCSNISEQVQVWRVNTDWAASPENFRIYPNPAKKLLTIEQKSPFKHTLISIYNANGKLVKKISGNLSDKTVVETEHFPAGVYFIRIADKDRVFSKKVVINN